MLHCPFGADPCAPRCSKWTVTSWLVCSSEPSNFESPPAVCSSLFLCLSRGRPLLIACCSPAILLHWVHQAILSRNGLHSASAGVLPASHSVARSDGTCRRQHAEAPVCPPARCAPPPLHASEVGACDSSASTVVVGRDAGDAQADLLRWLKQVYEVTAWEAPCLDAVPLLEFAGWTEGAANAPAPAFAPMCAHAAELSSWNLCFWEDCQTSQHMPGGNLKCALRRALCAHTGAGECADSKEQAPPGAGAGGRLELPARPGAPAPAPSGAGQLGAARPPCWCASKQVVAPCSSH